MTTKLRIHFIGSVEGAQWKYPKIMAAIESLGHEVITNHFAKRRLVDIKKETNQEAREYTTKALSWIRSCDILVAEVSKDDISIGIEAAIALQHSKPVIFIFEKGEGHLPFTMKGYSSSRIQLIEYEDHSLINDLRHAISYAREQFDIRFNMFLSPELMS